jgi:hypothetical protein
MFRSTLLSSLVLFLAGTTQALKVPLDLAPGVYSIPFDNNGVAAGDPVLLGPISARVRRALEARQQSPPRLQLPQARCQSSGTIVVADFDAAKADFQAYCDMGVANAAQTAVVYTIGNMIAYMCNYNSPNRCWREEYEQGTFYRWSAYMDVGCCHQKN